MNRSATMLLLGLCSLAIAGCAVGEPRPRSARAEAALDKALAGRVAGTPRSCISLTEIRSSRIIDGRTILFEGNGGTVWRNDPPGGCPGLYPGRTIVTRSALTQHCRNDIFRIVDLPAQMTIASCGFGDFVPYRKAS